MIRGFVGLSIPTSTARALEALQQGLPFARSVAPDNLHLTLAFLDDQPEHVLRELAEELGDIPGQPLALRLSGVALLGGPYARAIAVEVQPNEGLKQLQTQVSRRVSAVGIALGRRTFRPHVTLFRLSKRQTPSERDKIQDWLMRNGRFPTIEFEAREMALFESQLSSNGAQYSPLATYELG